MMSASSDYCLSCAGEGRFNSLLKTFAIGTIDNNAALEKAEEGQQSPARSSTSPTGAGEGNAVQYYVKLLFCVIGLQASYLTWGVLQVRITMRAWFRILRGECYKYVSL